MECHSWPLWSATPDHCEVPLLVTLLSSQLQASVQQSSVDKEELVGQVSLLQQQLEQERRGHQAEVGGGHTLTL